MMWFYVPLRSLVLVLMLVVLRPMPVVLWMEVAVSAQRCSVREEEAKVGL